MMYMDGMYICNPYMFYVGFFILDIMFGSICVYD
jgi:hypothetical protein